MRPSQLRRESLINVLLSTIDLWRQTDLSGRHPVSLKTPDDFNELCILADSARLQQVFLNLLENAAQNSPEGSDVELIALEPEHAEAADTRRRDGEVALVRRFEVRCLPVVHDRTGQFGRVLRSQHLIRYRRHFAVDLDGRGKLAVMKRSEPFFCDISRSRSCMNLSA